MQRNILNSKQIEFIKYFQKSNLIEDFYLSWGTALAEFYFQHRLSDDLDFFSKTWSINNPQVQVFLQELQKNTSIQNITKQKLYDRNLYNISYPDCTLKVEFSLYPKPIHWLVRDGGLYIESLEDIFIDKLMCLYDRNDPKDFVDLYYMIHDMEIDIASWLQWVQKKFWVWISHTSFAIACHKANSIRQLPIMKKPLTLIELQNFFNRLAYMFGKENIIE